MDFPKRWMMQIITTTGKLNRDGDICLHPGLCISWKYPGSSVIHELPAGTSLVINISLNLKTLLSDENGIVWASWDERQVEVIQNALLVQNISSCISKIKLLNGFLMLILLDNEKQISDALDFIWRKDSGLRLQPDWTYPDGEPNKSFEKWLNG